MGGRRRGGHIRWLYYIYMIWTVDRNRGDVCKGLPRWVCLSMPLNAFLCLSMPFYAVQYLLMLVYAQLYAIIMHGVRDTHVLG
jgi:hypothetical protein